MQTLRYDVLIENIKTLPLDEKEELKQLLEKYIIEERRNEIYFNYLSSKKEEETLTFTDNINELKEMV